MSRKLLTLIFLVLIGTIILYTASKFSVNKTYFTWDKNENSLVKTKDRKVIRLHPTNKNIDTKTIYSDMDNNDAEEKYSLNQGKLSVEENGRQLWESPNEWIIDNFAINDSTNADVLYLNLSVWKSGNYGSQKPFWVDENDMSFKNHFFIYNLKNSKLEPVWQSSGLDYVNQEFIILDINDDEENELVTIEKGYDNEEFCSKNYISVWKWDVWGFHNIWRSELNNYCNLGVKTINDKVFVTSIVK